MRHLVVLVLMAACGFADAQRLLEFRNDLVFSPVEVEATAARAFGARLRSLAQSGHLDPDPALKARLLRRRRPVDSRVLPRRNARRCDDCRSAE